MRAFPLVSCKMIRVNYNQFDKHFCFFHHVCLCLKANRSDLSFDAHKFILQHALSCPKGGQLITRHNELRNRTAEIIGEVCKNVVIEQLLTPLTGEELQKS